MNSKQVLITGMACVVAVLFFILTMLAGPNSKPDSQDGGSKLLALKWDTTESSTPKMQGLNIQFTDNHGIVYEMMGDSLTPKSQGVIDVIKPVARIHLKPNQTVLQIQANEGTFITPTSQTPSGMIGTVGQPQSGLLKGNVIIRVFENDSTNPIDLTDGSAHEILTMYMPQATFNRDLGEIEANGLIHIDGRDVAFEGEDLNIIYSPLLQRINRLEIQKGKFIRIKRIPKSSEDHQSISSQPDQLTKPQKNKKPAQYYHITLDDNVTIEAQKNKLTGNQLELFVGFENRKNSPQKTAPKTQPKTIQSTQPTTQPNRTATSQPDDSDDDILITWTGPLLMLPTQQKPTMLANAQDAYLQLHGRPMTITQPRGDVVTAANIDYLVSRSRLRLQSDDTYPLLIDSPQLGGLITAKQYEMDFKKGMGLLLGEGELHRLARSVIRDKTQAKANKIQTSLPPGTSVSWKNRVELLFFKNATQSKFSNFDALKTITFQGHVDVQDDRMDVQADRVTLQLTKPTQSKRKQETSLIEASGNVALRTHSPQPDKQMALNADLARVYFKPDPSGQMQPSELTAKGDVVIRQPQQILWANKLKVQLTNDKQDMASTEPQSEELPTTKYVDALDTMLAWEDPKNPVPTLLAAPVVPPLVPEKTHKKPSNLGSGLHVKLITVQGDVRARLINQGQPVFAFAHRISGDENQVELFGNDQRPAQVVHDQGILTGGHMVLTPKDQNLHVIGKGSLSYVSQPMEQKPKKITGTQSTLIKPQVIQEDQTVSEIQIDSPTPSPTTPLTTQTTVEKPTVIADESKDVVAPALPSLDPAQVTITWLDNMHYNHQSRQAQFLGQVLLQARKILSTTTVKGDQIQLLFNKFAQPAPDQDTPVTDMLPMDEQGMVSTQSLQGGRQVRMVNINGHAEFLEESWADPQKQNLLTRLRLAGDTIIFDAVPETITVPGPGTLLHEDHRPPPGSSETPGSSRSVTENSKAFGGSGGRASGGKTSGGDVQFTGRGQTLFRWQDQFLLDIAHNDMMMGNSVQMLHIPANSDNGIQLDCRTFLADMEATGGLGTWLGRNPPTPDLKVVQASHDVRITAQNRVITTDRATYIHNVRKVKLQAGKNKLTRISTPSGTSAPGAKLIIWELDTNRFYIARPGRMNSVIPQKH